jgi:hypothetical protein
MAVDAFGNQQQEPVDEFELMRRRIRGMGQQRGDQAQRDVQRKFASLGNLDSGAALDIQQQTAQQQEDQTSNQLMDVNSLEAQTRRQERTSEADRALQRYGIDTSEAGQTARLGQTLSSQERMQTQKIGSDYSIAKLGVDANERIAKLGNENAMSIAQLEAKTNTDLQRLSLDNARALAEWDRDLRQQGLDIQKVVANNQIDQSKIEGTLNTAATFINSLDVLKNAGFDLEETRKMFEALNIKIPELQGVITAKWNRDNPPPPQYPISPYAPTPSGAGKSFGTGIAGGERYTVSQAPGGPIQRIPA